MGAKNSKSSSSKKALPSQDEEKLLTHFGLQSTHDKISAANLKKIWMPLLEPSLLDQLLKCITKQNQVADNYMISVDTLLSVYFTFVRGRLEEMAGAIADMIGSTTNSNEEVVTSYKNVQKYVSDLIASHVKVLENGRDKNLLSWSAGSRKTDPSSLQAIVAAWCGDLAHDDDEVKLYDLEQWLSHSGMITSINTLLISSLYNLKDRKTNLIPKVVLPTPKTQSMLDASQIIYLNSFLPSEYRNQWRFLFSTVTHGESFSTMMGNITNQGPTLLIVRDSNQYTFGGFASDSWVPGPKFVGTESCFLLKLTPETKIFSSTGYNDHYMYVNCNQTTLPNGLGMGGQFGYWGLWLDSHFGVGECSEVCTTFRNYDMPAASKKFTIAHLEIWGVGDPPPTPADLGERTSSVLDKDPTVTQMLEMIGRKQHSKGLRESPGRVKPMFPSEDAEASDED